MEEKTILDIENEKRLALDLVESIYYTPTSPHYKDNERYAWAIKAIYERFGEKISDFKRENKLK